MSASDLHSAWARLFVRALATAGVRDVVVSPGSRSTPLVLAVADEPALRRHVAVDERAAGFFALGQARATGRPSALVCTSGSAGAHYLPALVEARRAHLPLVVVTADRPWDAYDCAAPQTVDQVKLFGDHVVHYAELGLPQPAPEALRAVVRVAAQAVHRASWPEPGPAHVNARFRKPLEPVRGAGREAWADDVDALVRAGAPALYAPRVAPAPEALDALAAACAGAARGLIVCGPTIGAGDGARLRAAARDLAGAAGFPLLPEATSGARFGAEPDGAVVCGFFDAALRDGAFREAHPPELVVELGAPPTSSAWPGYVAGAARCARWVVAPHGWNDPLGGAAALVWGDPADVARGVAARLARRAVARSPWAEDFAAAEARARAAVDREREAGALTEGNVARAVVDALGDVPGATLVVGNSNPVRDLDTYCPASPRALRVLHQRGASGIDGLVAGAAGTRSVAEGPVALLVGDLSFLHDVASLNLARAVPGPLVVVVVNNDGGRIFEALPVGRDPGLGGAFERLFVTPQGLAFEHAAAQFGAAYRRVEALPDLAHALDAGLASGGCTVVEARVPPHDGAARRARVWRDAGGAR